MARVRAHARSHCPVYTVSYSQWVILWYNHVQHNGLESMNTPRRRRVSKEKRGHVNERIKLSRFADSQGISYEGAYKMWRNGLIEGIQLPTGTILVSGWKSENNNTHEGSNGNTVIIYARVSNNQNRNNLDSQAQRLVEYCAARGYQVSKIVKEAGSGLNDKRPKLLKILQQSDWGVLVVEHKDRLTRFGYPFIELAVAKTGQCVEIVNQSNDTVSTDADDLMQDFVAVVTSFCARLYGLRRSQRKTETLIRELAKAP